MNNDMILFDLNCLEKGLPPFSGSARDIVTMIKSMPPEERRKISRKIRKLSKKAVRQSITNARTESRKKFLKEMLRNSLNLGPQKKGFKTSEMLRRVSLVRSMLINEFTCKT